MNATIQQNSFVLKFEDVARPSDFLAGAQWPEMEREMYSITHISWSKSNQIDLKPDFTVILYFNCYPNRKRIPGLNLT